MSVTVKDIASDAGVSTATVSNVLTKKKYVSEEIEQKVLASIKKLKYVPNTHARNLKTNKSFTIGIQVPDISNPFFSEIIKYAQIEANKENYQILLCSSNGDIAMEEKNLTEFLRNGVDGIVSVAPRMNPVKFEELVDIPTIVVDRKAFKTEKNIGFIYTDNYNGGSLAAEYFVEKGFSQFLCFSGPVESVSNAKLRTEGFIHRLNELGVQPPQYDIHYCEFSFELGYQCMEKIILANQLVTPCAAFICSDIVAWGAMEALKKYKYKIPKDVAIIGYDNIYFTDFIYPNLSTIDNPTVKYGKLSMRNMINALRTQEPISNINMVLDSSLIIRNST